MRQYSQQPFNQHYFNQESQDTSQYFPIIGKSAGYSFKLQSAKGVFSAEKFDKGTSILLKHFKKEIQFGLSRYRDSQCFLDLGCGYGLVSVWITTYLGSKDPSVSTSYRIDALDISPLAVDLTQHNIKMTLDSASLKNIDFSVCESDIFSHKYFAKKQYDAILTNPPFSAGKATVQKFISESFRYLRPGGSLRVVAPTSRGAKTYIRYTQEIFNNIVEVVALESGFRVRKATKPLAISV